MTNIFKLAIIFITLLSILTLTACTQKTEEIMTETSAAAIIADEINRNEYAQSLSFKDGRLSVVS